jgi:hypothetical protein
MNRLLARAPIGPLVESALVVFLYRVDAGEPPPD